MHLKCAFFLIDYITDYMTNKRPKKFSYLRTIQTSVWGIIVNKQKENEEENFFVF